MLTTRVSRTNTLLPESSCCSIRSVLLEEESLGSSPASKIGRNVWAVRQLHLFQKGHLLGRCATISLNPRRVVKMRPQGHLYAAYSERLWPDAMGYCREPRVPTPA